MASEVMNTVMMAPQTKMLVPKNGANTRPPSSSMPITKNPLMPAAT